MSAAVTAPCDAGVVASTEPREAAHASALLAATILGSSVAFIDGSVVNVALPAIQHDLNASAAATQWLINAYLLPMGALILIGGAMGDRYGRRRIFVIGLGVFTAASVLCALASGVATLLAARALQGVGAALLTPASLAMLGAGFSGPARGRAIGTWAAAGAITGAVGPVLGGWMIDTIGWRSIFLLNLPIAGAAMGLAIRYVEETRDRAAAPHLDWQGAALATFGLGALAWGLTVLHARGADTAVVSSLIVGTIALIAFIAIEARLGLRAMMPLALFGSKPFVGVTLLTLFLYAALSGLLVVLPYLLIRIAHYPATAAGAALLPLPIAIGLASRGVGRLTEHTGPRLPLTIGPLIVAAGFALMARVTADHLEYWSAIFPPLVLIACGMAASVAPLTATVMAAVDADHVGAASGVNNAIARVAALLATALVGAVLASDATPGIFIAQFHVANWIGALLAAAAGASAFALLATTVAAERADAS
jgi:EmrB/QacA subfamily drug resistance transporter